MTRPSLLASFDPRFRLVEGGESYDRDRLFALARAVVLPEAEVGSVVELPARSPLETLVHLEAAIAAGFIALPSSRSRTPRVVLPSVRRPSLALALRTSGSTGEPSHPGFRLEAVVRSASRIAADLALTSDDRVGLLQPTDHGFGLVGQLLASGVVGATAIAASRAFASERAAALVDAQVSVFAAVPYGIAQLLPCFADRSTTERARIRQIGVAGGALAPSLARAIRAALPDAVLVHQYGCTEAGPRLTSIRSDEAGFETGSVGRPLPGVTLAILEPDASGVGEVAFASDMAMDGYLDADVAERDGRFRTGDLGRIDADGLLHLVGRIDDVIKIRGEKVALPAVARLAETAGAREAVAVFVRAPNGEGDGTIAVVYVAARELPLRAFVGALGPGVLPKRLLRVAELPRLPSGKPDRRAIERLLRDEDRATGNEAKP